MRNLRFGFFKETKYPFYRRLYGPQGLSGRMRKSTVPSGFDLPNAQASSESLCRLRHPGPSINSKVIILHLDIPSVFLLKTWNYRYFLPLENFCVGLRISACNDYNGVSFLKFVLFIYLFIVNYWLKCLINNYRDYIKMRGTAVVQRLRCCATNRKVAGSIPDGVIGNFHWHNPSDRPMALGSTQPLTEMSTRNI